MSKSWAGVDGCRRGWVVAAIDPTYSVLYLKVQRTFGEVILQCCDAELTLVDIPIGLPSAQHAKDRSCDYEARRLLKPKGAAVFPVPTREAVWSSNYHEACEQNKKILHKGLSRQSWAISSKIREVDAVFRLVPQLQTRIRETHPELCFRLLNSRGPVESPKKKPEGQNIRRNLLSRCLKNADGAVREARSCYAASRVKTDDFLDALAAAVVARMAADQEVGSLPSRAEYDACGLRMEMVGAEADKGRVG